jgi:hypothetical protein
MELVALLCLTVPSVSAGTLIFLTPPEAAELKSHPDAGFTAILRSRAEAALKQGPWTVTSERPVGRKLPPNEYYSEAPYYWPDPARPGKMDPQGRRA